MEIVSFEAKARHNAASVVKPKTKTVFLRTTFLNSSIFPSADNFDSSEKAARAIEIPTRLTSAL